MNTGEKIEKVRVLWHDGYTYEQVWRISWHGTLTSRLMVSMERTNDSRR